MNLCQFKDILDTLNKCPLYYIQKEFIKNFDKCGISKYKIINNHREYF